MAGSDIEGEVLRSHLQIAHDAGAILVNPNANGDFVVDSTQMMLMAMGCNLETGGVDERFRAISTYTDESPIDRDSPIFSGLVGATTSAILLRGAEQPSELAELLKAYMDGATEKGFSKTYVRLMVRREIVSHQHLLRGTSSYAGVGAVKDLDAVLDELHLSTLGVHVRRIARTIGSHARFGANIFR